MRDFIDLHPLLPVAVSLIVGILVSEWLPVGIIREYLFVVLFSALAIAVVAYSFFRRSHISSIFLLIACTAFGTYRAMNTNDELSITETSKYENFNAVIVSTPKETSKKIAADLYVVDGRHKGKTIRAGFTKNDSSKKLKVGARLRIKAKLWKPQRYGNSRFDFPLYLKSHGIAATTVVYDGNWEYTDFDKELLPTLTRYKIRFLRHRDKLVDGLRRQRFEGQALAVIAAMTLGDKSEISRETTDVYSITGASHILALSGLHLSIVFSLFSIFGRRWKHSLLTVTLVVAMIWSYVLLAGMPISMIRSAIMLSVTTIIGLAHRDGMTLNTLAFAAILIVVANPFAIHDVGFQLSFLAVAFIAGYASGTYNLVPTELLLRHRIFRWCWQICVTSTLAQLGTSPLVIYHFGRFPTYFLLTNFIAIPAATIVLYLSVLLLVSYALPFVTTLTASCLFWTAILLNKYLSAIATLPFASLNLDWIKGYDVAFAYFALLVLLYPLRKIEHDRKRYTSISEYTAYVRLKRELTSRH